jgi:hypothetical protein
LAMGLGVIAAALLLAAPGSATAASCEVGQPSTHEPPGGGPILSDVLIIGCGQALGEPVEIAAYETEDWLCVQVFHPDVEVSPFASCPHGRPHGGEAIDLMSAGLLDPPPGITYADTDLRFNVTKVKVRFRGEGGVRSGDTVLARVHAALAERLGQPSAFGYFISFVPGCAFDGVKARALNKRGDVAGTSKGGTPGCP